MAKPDGLDLDTAQIVDHANNVGAVLGILLSTVFLSGLNIIASGHLFAYVFGLDRTGMNRFRITVPFLFYMEIKGDAVVAGIIAFSVSVFLVAWKLSDTATAVFITNADATDETWIAVQMLSTTLSVTVAVVLAGCRSIYEVVRLVSAAKKPPDDPAARAKRIVQ